MAQEKCKNNQMYTVYRFYDDSGTLLYVGCSSKPLARLSGHRCQRDNFHYVTRMTLTWYETQDEAATQEAKAILDEHPKWNKYFSKQDMSKITGRKPGDRPRHMGVTCPRCHDYKPDRSQAYCRPCTAAEQLERRLAAGWTPVIRTGLCPRCKEQPTEGKGYCKPCKRAVNAIYRSARPHLDDGRKR